MFLFRFRKWCSLRVGQVGRLGESLVDGVYGQHPILRHLYDLKIVLSIDPARQSARLLKRNGEALHKRFIAEWIPLEELYLTGTHARERADLVYSV